MNIYFDDIFIFYLSVVASLCYFILQDCIAVTLKWLSGRAADQQFESQLNFAFSVLEYMVAAYDLYTSHFFVTVGIFSLC